MRSFSTHSKTYMNIIIDAHQDLAWNMLTFKRDYTLSAAETRQKELNSTAVEQNGDTLLGWPEFQKGRVAIIFNTLFVSPARRKMGQWDSEFYSTYDEAHSLYKKQIEAYQRLTDHHPDKFKQILNARDLKTIWHAWQTAQPDQTPPIGFCTLMEGAEGIRNPDELMEWWELGVRTIGLAWAGTRYCGGTGDPGPLTPEGFALINAMQEIGFTLDISHMDYLAAQQALENYQGHLIASHANPIGMLKGTESNRHLQDDIIEKLVARNGIMGIVPANPFLKFGWDKRKNSTKEEVSLSVMADHIDYVCQIAGNANHVAIGSDFDGGFGLQHVPAEIDTIADLQKLAAILQERGYTEEDIQLIFHKNWLNHLQKALPS